MADITITAASVVPGANATQIQGTAGETITAGMAVYLKSSDSRWWKAQADGTSAESGVGSNTLGVALTGSSAGQPIIVDTADTNGITIGGTTVVGTVYCVSATAGGICPWADLASTNYVTIVGVGDTSNKIKMIVGGATGIAHA